jgi:2-polyprenyl-6-methoxyphenol hydroxylase-like FAD-dependent oxidoreductase
MKQTTEIPVLVVGGGASGTMLSLQLSRYGVNFRTIDRLPGPAPTSRAITVHSRMLEIFELLDENLLKQFLNRGIVNEGYDLHYIRDGRRHVVPMGIDFTTSACNYPYLLIHRQDETEQTLRDYWTLHFQQEAEWGKKLVNLEQRANGNVCVVEDTATGEQEIIFARYVIACDGVNSRVRQSLDLVQDESSYPGTVLQNLDIRLNNFPGNKQHIHYCAGTDHFMMVAYLPGDFYRLLVSDRGESAGSEATPEASIQKLMDLHFDGVTMGERIWHSRWESRVTLAKTYRDQRVFLVGDSAHVHSTTGGQGMNCCIQDAWNLGWKLGMVESGLARPGLLDTYESERRPVAEQVIWAASSLHDIFMGHGQDISRRESRMDDPDYLRKVVGCCSGIAYTYRASSLNDTSIGISGPGAGDRAPDVAFQAGSSLYSLLRDTRFTLLTTATEVDVHSQLTSLASCYHGSIRFLAIPDIPAFQAVYGNSRIPLTYLFRPDGYIACCHPSADMASLTGWLQTRLIPG